MHQQILIAVGGVGGGSVITLDPLKKGSGAVLSAGNLTLGVSGVTGMTALSTAGYTSGKRYFEAAIFSVGTWAAVGFSRAGSPADYNTDLGQEAGEYGMTKGGMSYFAGSFGGVSGSSFSSGDVIGVALDFDTRMAWWSKNGTFMSGNPAAGTGAMVTYASGLGTIFAALQGTGGASITAKFSSSDLVYTPPTGFIAYG